jgi:hypothetical protein
MTRSRGVSLAKGPVAIIGLLGVIYGISALIFGSHSFALHIPHGNVTGKRWIALEANGWTALLFLAAGLVLLLGAAALWSAKTMSFLVGLVLLAAAVVAIIRGNGVFGIFAANHWTEIIWAAAGVLLLILSWMPRVGGGTRVREEPVRTTTAAPATGGRLSRRRAANEEAPATADDGDADA